MYCIVIQKLKNSTKPKFVLLKKKKEKKNNKQKENYFTNQHDKDQRIIEYKFEKKKYFHAN